MLFIGMARGGHGRGGRGRGRGRGRGGRGRGDAGDGIPEGTIHRPYTGSLLTRNAVHVSGRAYSAVSSLDMYMYLNVST